MAAVAFDTLKVARRLIDAGMPAKQAEAQAEMMAEAVVFNVDTLVTKDYLDARLESLEARVEGKIDSLSARFDGKFSLLSWMLAVVIASTTVPGLYSLLSS